MKHALLFVLPMMLVLVARLDAQTAGNQVYRNNYGSSDAQTYTYLTDSTYVVQANVLMNVKADQFVAVFGVSEDGATIEEASREIDRRIAGFIDRVKRLGVSGDDIFVDLITQNRIYDYKMSANVATQVATGFEVKKNVSIRFGGHSTIDKLVIAASESKIFDLVKVDYLVTNIDSTYQVMHARAAEIIARKRSLYEKLTGTPALPRAEVFIDDFRTRYPSGGYRQYAAYETGGVSSDDPQSKLVRMEQRKSRTFYFESVDKGGFDAIINPVILEPVVQFTLTLGVRYQIR